MYLFKKSKNQIEIFKLSKLHSSVLSANRYNTLANQTSVKAALIVRQAACQNAQAHAEYLIDRVERSCGAQELCANFFAESPGQDALDRSRVSGKFYRCPISVHSVRRGRETIGVSEVFGSAGDSPEFLYLLHIAKMLARRRRYENRVADALELLKIGNRISGLASKKKRPGLAGTPEKEFTRARYAFCAARRRNVGTSRSSAAVVFS